MRKLLTRSATLMLVGLTVWPVFTVVSLGYSYLQGEGSVLNTWYLEPKRNLLAHFLNGLINSAPIALSVALVALLCSMASRRLKWIRLLPLLLLTVAGATMAQWLFPGSTAMLICLSVTGLIVAIDSVVITRYMRKLNR